MEEGAINSLTSAEVDEGWQLLFDGETSEGWRGFKKDGFPDGWTVEDGAIAWRESAGDIITVEQFDDFELALDWKISPGGNSGIFLRVSEEEDHTFFSGTEMQILDNDGHSDGKDPLTMVGSNYALYPPKNGKDWTNPIGEWNRVLISMQGAHTVFHLNGEQVVEFELWSQDWRDRVAESKFAEWSLYGQPRRGHIALQDHGDPVWFRNIKLRRI